MPKYYPLNVYEHLYALFVFYNLYWEAEENPGCSFFKCAIWTNNQDAVSAIAQLKLFCLATYW